MAFRRSVPQLPKNVARWELGTRFANGVSSLQISIKLSTWKFVPLPGSRLRPMGSSARVDAFVTALATSFTLAGLASGATASFGLGLAAALASGFSPLPLRAPVGHS